MYEKPLVGKQIRVVTRHPNQVVNRPGDTYDNVYVGTVLSDTKWTLGSQFEMTGNEDSRVPLRRVALDNVVELEYLDGGKIGQQNASVLEEKVYEVKGSKGKVYTVIVKNGKATCTCPGFQFRRNCKHVKQYTS